MTSLPVLLPPGFLPRVTKGDHVAPGTILATLDRASEVRIDIPSVLQLPKRRVGSLLKKKPGDRVQKGDVIAVKRKLLGMKEDVIISSVEGTVLQFDREKGQLTLLSTRGEESGGSRDHQSLEHIVSPIDGVVEVCDNDKILLSTDKDVLPVLSGIGGEVTGEVFVVAESIQNKKPVLLHQLGVESIGKIVVGRIFERDVLLKAVGMGTTGIIGAEIKDEDLAYVRGKHLSVPIVTVDTEVMRRLISWNSRRVYLQGEQKTILLLHL